MKFDACLDPSRFWFILEELYKADIIDNFYHETIRKTGCFYSKKFNVYIDTSDGINDDYGLQDPCERILAIVKETRGKPFLFFKNYYSPTLCSNIEKVASENNGKVIPFFYWDHSDSFRYYEWSIRKELTKKSKMAKKIHDVGMCARIEKYKCPLPSMYDPRISWKGAEWFGLYPAKDMGYVEIDTRLEFFEKFLKSRFNFHHITNVPFEKMLDESMKWKAVFDPPGNANVSFRMLEHGWLAQCVILRKSDVDFAVSWKPYFPEVNFKVSNWEDQIGTILSEKEEWGEKSLHYLETYCNPKYIVDYFVQTINEFEGCL